MKDVIIYTTKTCPFCYKAKRLLKGLDITYQEISVDFNSKLRAEMASKAGKTSVPQIFVDDKYFGGLTELISYYKEK
ncbi:MAG: glutaredoxin domain-containing protein [SAR86 cluster bacterium]|nr:glutaredoxin domain-containing protein [SAR86 cluster bacterium]